MVIVCEDSITRPNGKKGFYMDGKLKDNIDYELKRVDKNWDCVMLYDGEEGSAKTTLACANAYYMANARGSVFNDDRENNNHIIYTIKEFENLLRTSEPYTNIVWDEFVLAGMSLDALKRIQITLIKRMTLMRKKRLVVHLLVPYMFMLSKYFAIARPRCLIHVYSPNNLDRGSFRYYSKPSKRRLYIKGVKFWDYFGCSSDFPGSFTNTYGYFFDTPKYEAKKDEAMIQLEADTKNAKLGKRIATIIHNLKELGYTHKKICKICEFSSTGTITSYLERYKTPKPRILGAVAGDDLIST